MHDDWWYRTESVALGLCSIHPESPVWGGLSPPGSIRDLVFPRIPIGVRARGICPVALHAGHMITPKPNRTYARVRLAEEGERSDVLWIAPALVEEFLPGWVEGRNPHEWCHQLEPRALLRQRALFSAARSEALEPVLVEEEAVALVRTLLVPAREPPEPPERTRSIAYGTIVFLLGHLGERLCLKQLALALGASPSYLCTSFREGTGSTIGSYLQRLRLCVAVDRLMERNADLSGLALDLGFCSHSHFSARFRRLYGCTPTEARRRLLVGP